MESKKRDSATAWVDPDDAPEFTGEMLDKAGIFHGDTLIGRGRPKSSSAKELISLRLDPDVLAKLRESGPGWQSRINDLLRHSLGLPQPPSAVAGSPRHKDTPRADEPKRPASRKAARRTLR